jgi:hypothetical protein
VAELTLFRTGADTLKGSAGLVPVGVMPRRNKARDFSAVSGDRHFLAVLDQVESVDGRLHIIEKWRKSLLKNS